MTNWSQHEGRLVIDRDKPHLRPVMTVLDTSRGVIPNIVEVRPATDAEVENALQMRNAEVFDAP